MGQTAWDGHAEFQNLLYTIGTVCQVVTWKCFVWWGIANSDGEINSPLRTLSAPASEGGRNMGADGLGRVASLRESSQMPHPCKTRKDGPPRSFSRICGSATCGGGEKCRCDLAANPSRSLRTAKANGRWPSWLARCSAPRQFRAAGRRLRVRRLRRR